ADPCSDNCRFSAVLSSRSDSVRKVQPRTGSCQIVRKVLPRTGSCQSGDRHRSSGH
ncbi:unnamed protein product, partial [Staurois parvus]